MKRYRYALFALLMFGWGNQINASIMPEINPTTTNDSCYPEFAVQFRALALRPSASNLNYAAQAVPIPLPSPNWCIFEVQPDYHFGFDLYAHAFFPDKCTSLRANWLHFKHTDNACHQVSSTEYMVGPFFEIGPDAALYKNTTGDAAVRFDMVNLNYAQYIDLCNTLQTNLFVGASFARIAQKRFSTYANEDATIVRTICVPIEFKGAGPQLGVDLYYDLCRYIYLTNRTSFALLFGKVKNCTTFQAFAPELPDLGITPPNTQYITSQSNLHVIPNIDIQLGLAFASINCQCIDLQVEVGYQALIYIHALQFIEMGSEVITPPVIPDTVGVFARTFRKTLSNFSLAGPYVSVGLVF